MEKVNPYEDDLLNLIRDFKAAMDLWGARDVADFIWLHDRAFYDRLRYLFAN